MFEHKAVFFDLDGTLIDTSDDIAIAANRSIRHFGVAPKTTAEVRSYIGNGMKVFMESMTGSKHRWALIVFRFYYWLRIAHHSRPFPGVMDVLEELKKQGVPMYVWTNKLKGLSVRLLHKMKMRHYFVDVIGGDEIRKPELGSLQAYFPQGLPQNSAMVGDSTIDVQAGKNAGFKTYAFLGGFGNREKILAKNPDHSFDHYTDLSRLWFPN